MVLILCPKEAAGNIAKSIESVQLERVKAIEDEINHDMMAVVIGITEQCTEEEGKWVHFGATSNDIVNLVDPDRYIGTAVEQVEAVVAKLQTK